MNEDDLARRIVRHLDESLEDIPARDVERLHAARGAALRHARARKAGTGAGLSGWLERLAGHGLVARLAVPAALAVAVVAGLLYWQITAHHESIDVETALLADELPIHAYTDPGFDTWLRHASQEQQ
ncbi:MAG TPA: DUF3619 family protein [Burkholderiales bacterium]|nr:DUF3619 family protein [Burkholderiales bacterium]